MKPDPPVNTILKASGIEKRFGGVQALIDAEVSIQAGEVHALMGENGAGKSTLGKIIAGVIRADAGVIEWEGKRVHISNPLDAQRLGIGIIFQELDLFPNLSIAENIAVENLHFDEGVWVRRSRLNAFCQPYLDQVGLDISLDKRVGELSMGQMQLVAIARALSMQARVLVMDESTSALTGDMVENLFSLISRLREQGVAIIYVSHKMDEIFRIADRVTVMRDGRVVGTSLTAETDVQEIIHLMVGREVLGKERSISQCSDTVIFEAEGMCTKKIQEISFSLNAGEVLGVAGLVGSGRSELGNAMYGVDPVISGRMKLQGKLYKPRHPHHACSQGVGLVPEDRKLQGLMMQMSVRENSSISSLSYMNRLGFLQSTLEQQGFDNIAQKTRLKAGSPMHAVSTLSGGNQQKVLLGRWLMVDSQLLFLDDPTRGVDVGAKEDIYSLIEELAEQGKGIVMVSSELSELLRCCDRILVMNEGRLQGIVDVESTSQEDIMTLATATKSS